MILDRLRNSTPINSTLLFGFRQNQFNIGTATEIKLTLNVKVRNLLKEIKFKIIGQCPYTNRYFVQIIYQKGGAYAKITDFYKSIGAAKKITTETWNEYGDISQVDLERFTAAEKMKEEDLIAATMLSVGLSEEDNEQIVFRSIWMPAKKSTGPEACRQRVNVKKYHDLRRNRNLMLEDVKWSDLANFSQGCTDYQLLFHHPYDGLLRIKLDSFSGKQGRLSLV